MAVVTTADRPKGRGLSVQSNPVKERCQGKNFLVLTPASLKEGDAEKQIASLRPDVFVVASYGKLIPSSWLQIPSKASFNIHPSLLPKYRGAAPIPWQIINGEKETGLSIADVTKELDAGDIFYQTRIPLNDDATTGSLTQQLSELSKKGLEELFAKLEKLERRPQKGESSYARKLTKEDGLLDLSEPAVVLERKIRAFHPWPSTFIDYQGHALRILEASVASISCSEAESGALLEITSQGSLRIQTGKGALLISKLQLAGRRVVTGKEFANGERLKPGARFKSLSSLK